MAARLTFADQGIATQSHEQDFLFPLPLGIRNQGVTLPFNLSLSVKRPSILFRRTSPGSDDHDPGIRSAPRGRFIDLEDARQIDGGGINYQVAIRSVDGCLQVLDLLLTITHRRELGADVGVAPIGLENGADRNGMRVDEGGCPEVPGGNRGGAERHFPCVRVGPSSTTKTRFPLIRSGSSTDTGDSARTISGFFE